MKLIIVRHGQTIENDTGIIMGQQPGRLSKLGKEQAKKLGQELKGKKIDFIYSSDLGRTKDTVKEIIKHHPNTPVVYDPLLRERSFGIYEQWDRQKVIDKVGEKALYATYAPPGGESPLDITNRAKKFLDYLFEHHKDSETILICTHGGWKHAFYRLVKNITPGKYISNLDFENASISTVNLSSDLSHRFLHLGRTKHLE